MDNTDPTATDRYRSSIRLTGDNGGNTVDNLTEQVDDKRGRFSSFLPLYRNRELHYDNRGPH